MSSKTCIDCGILKELDLFHKRPGSKDGHRNNCKICRSKSDRNYKDSKPGLRERDRQRFKEYNENLSPQKKEEKRLSDLAYWKRNRDKSLHNNRKRKARLKQALPKWAEDDFEELHIKEMYHLRELREKLFGIKFNVDHIVPLTSTKVCGLHCAANLRIISEFENKSKNNRHWPDMW